MTIHYLVKLEMLIGHVLPLSNYRKKLQNLSHLNCDLHIRQIWIQLITPCEQEKMYRTRVTDQDAGLRAATLLFSGQENFKISGHFQDIKTTRHSRKFCHTVSQQTQQLPKTSYLCALFYSPAVSKHGSHGQGRPLPEASNVPVYPWQSHSVSEVFASWQQVLV